MFGLLISGRLVSSLFLYFLKTDTSMSNIWIINKKPDPKFERISETQFMIQITNIENVNHVVVFMTGKI